MGVTIEGGVTPGFERVADAFARNFADHGHVGAAVCVYRDGKPVVDLWAWPEFAAAGKAGIPVRWLLTHQAGLPVLDRPVPLADALAWHPVVGALAAQAPAWTPGTAHGYHAQTFGWLVGEVIRRVSGRSVGRFVAEEIAGPLGLDLFIGLPDSEHPQVSALVFAPPPDLARLVAAGVPEDMRDLAAAAMDPNSLLNRPATDPAIDFSAPRVWRAEIPASNGIGTA
ncbi:MAG: serine hydrolase domain-containing protein, partial [Streptosporangiaceae bacterium]